MQFLKSIAICASALAAFAAAQSTQVAIYNMPDTVMVGKATQLQIHSGNGPFTLTLRRGNPNDLKNVSTITTTGTGSGYSWTPDSNLESGSDYAIMISQGDQANYTPLFTITGGKKAGSGSAPAGYGGASSSSSAAPTTMATSASATSAAPGCQVTQIKDGQPQAPASCTSSAAAASSSATYASSNSTASSSAPAGGYSPYNPMPGATGSPASSNSTVPTYSVPSPTKSSSGAGSTSGSQSSAASAPAKTGGAAQVGSSFALVAGAVAAFAFLN